MMPGSEGPTIAGSAHDSSGHTIELELTGEQQLALTARPVESGLVLPVPVYENFAVRRTARIDFVCNVTVAEVAPAAGAAEPQGTPVRINNAFDATEVFEFPQGTSESEAREAVAELLLSRARDRRAEGLALRRAGNLQPDRGAALQQPEAFVTRLLARAKEP
jgi:hypothetical protein